MSEIIKTIQTTDSEIICCKQKLEELIVKRRECVSSMTLSDAVFLINKNRTEDSLLCIKPLIQTNGKKPTEAILYTTGTFPIGFLLQIKPGEISIQENYLKSKSIGLRFTSEKIESPVFPFCCVDNNTQKDALKACEELGLKVLLTWVTYYDLRYKGVKFKPENTEVFNPIWENQGSFLGFHKLCSKLSYILNQNMPGKVVSKLFTGVGMHCKMIEKKSIHEITHIAKISHYGIATDKKTEESVELQIENSSPQGSSHEHLSSWEHWQQEVEQREWDREMGHDFC